MLIDGIAAWLGRGSRARQVRTRRGQSESPVALETVKAIAELAAKEYANEIDIHKSLDTKSATWIAASGAVLIFALGTVGKIPPSGKLLGWGRVGFNVRRTGWRIRQDHPGKPHD